MPHHPLVTNVFAPAVHVAEGLSNISEAGPSEYSDIRHSLEQLKRGLDSVGDLTHYPADVQHAIIKISQIIQGLTGQIGYSDVVLHLRKSDLKKHALEGWRALEAPRYRWERCDAHPATGRDDDEATHGFGREEPEGTRSHQQSTSLDPVDLPAILRELRHLGKELCMAKDRDYEDANIWLLPYIKRLRRLLPEDPDLADIPHATLLGPTKSIVDDLYEQISLIGDLRLSEQYCKRAIKLTEQCCRDIEVLLQSKEERRPSPDHHVTGTNISNGNTDVSYSVELDRPKPPVRVELQITLFRRLIASLNRFVEEEESSDPQDPPEAIYPGHYLHNDVVQIQRIYRGGKLPPSIRPVWMDVLHVTRGKRQTGRPNQEAIELASKFLKWAEDELGAIERLYNHQRGDGGVVTALMKKPKQSTERGDGQTKLTAALIKHHQYAHGSCLNSDPIGNNKLAQQAKVSRSTASAFFRKQFGGHTKYRAVCRDVTQLVTSLKLLNQEFSPFHLYGAKPPSDDERNDGE